MGFCSYAATSDLSLVSGLVEDTALLSLVLISTSPSFTLKIKYGSKPMKEYLAIFAGPFTLSRRKLFGDMKDS